MATKIRYIDDENGNHVFPVTHERAVRDSSNVTLDTKLATFITASVNNLTNYYLKSETYTKSEVEALISAIKQFSYTVASSLPTASSETMYKFYLVPSSDPQTQNVKDEFITVENSGVYTWEQIGSTAIDLSDYVTTTALNTALANYVTSTALASALTGKQDLLVSGTNIKTLNSNSLLGSGNVVISDGKSAYQSWIDAGNSGTEADFLASLQGNSGYTGEAGELEVVNNVTEGGATAALSAEQGKLLANRIGNMKGSGSFQEAYMLSLTDTSIWSWLLVETDYEDSITKPIWHIGNSIFVDASGAIIEFEIDDLLIHNLKYTIKLTSDNQTIYVPTSSFVTNYDMVVDWGDGSPRTTKKGTATLKTVGHTYSGSAGDTFQITLGGRIPSLLFSYSSAWERATLVSVDNNTLQYPINLTYNAQDANTCFGGCVNLETLSENAFHNVTDTCISFLRTTKLSSESAFAALDSLPDIGAITRVSFEECPASFTITAENLSKLTGLTTFFKMFYKSSVVLSADAMAVLKGLGNQITSYNQMFYNYKGSAAIPDDFFSLASTNQISSVLSFTQAATSGSLSGDAYALYTSVSTKITETATHGNAFSFSGLSNRNQVPTTWGGTLSVE